MRVFECAAFAYGLRDRTRGSDQVCPGFRAICPIQSRIALRTFASRVDRRCRLALRYHIKHCRLPTHLTHVLKPTLRLAPLHV